MTTLRKVSVAQLNKIINETQTELSRRQNIDSATAEIRSILEKYKIDFKDIKLNTPAKADGKRGKKKQARAAKPRDQRSTVKAKYKDPNSTATWSGRGRTPGWVRDICQIEGISIEGFKKDSRFRC